MKMERVFVLRMMWTDQSMELADKNLVTYYFPEDNDVTKDIFPDMKFI